jgi:hypothetical protein
VNPLTHSAPSTPSPHPPSHTHDSPPLPPLPARSDTPTTASAEHDPPQQQHLEMLPPAAAPSTSASSSTCASSSPAPPALAPRRLPPARPSRAPKLVPRPPLVSCSSTPHLSQHSAAPATASTSTPKSDTIGGMGGLGNRFSSSMNQLPSLPPPSLPRTNSNDDESRPRADSEVGDHPSGRGEGRGARKELEGQMPQ